MVFKNYSFSINTTKREEFIEITKDINDFLKKSRLKTGYVKIFIPHTTVAVTINENADFDVQRDMITLLRKMAPQGGFIHSENNSDAHLKSSLFSINLDVFIQNHKLLLGTWQGIYFCEFDGPRQRKIHMLFVGEEDLQSNDYSDLTSAREYY